jgi:hypothetical protein
LYQSNDDDAQNWDILNERQQSHKTQHAKDAERAGAASPKQSVRCHDDEEVKGVERPIVFVNEVMPRLQPFGNDF